MPIDPTVFMPGFPKSATTWLYTCALSMFSAERVCRSANPARWLKPGCTNRFLLPMVSTNSLGDVRFNKEPFAFGGTGISSIVGDDGNLTKLHGPDPRTAPASASSSVLWLWEKNELRKERWLRAARGGSGSSSSRGADERASFIVKYERQTRRVSELCERAGLGSGHPSCARVGKDQADPAGWACKWDERAYKYLNRTSSYCLSSATPWLAEGEANATIIDFTPNYMCDPDAMRRIRTSSKSPDDLRFIVLARDPVMRAFSEFAMFAYGYFWETASNFSSVTPSEDRTPLHPQP